MFSPQSLLHKMDEKSIQTQLRAIFTPSLLLQVYNYKFPWPKGSSPSGAIVGNYVFNPPKDYIKNFYALTFRPALLPLSRLPLDILLEIDFTTLLPPTNASDYPEQALGLITIIDQARIICSGYNKRYMRAFFDPLGEKLARHLIALPEAERPDGKHAWLSRGYSMDEWLTRTLWFWAPLVHADTFMVDDRATLKDWLHSMRAEIEECAGRKDPFAKIEAEDDVDLRAFQTIEDDGPPKKGYEDETKEAEVVDYAFWWIRILNSHFAITDYCGHYPYWIRWKGVDWTDEDRHFFKLNDNYRHSAEDESALQRVKRDVQDGAWRELKPEARFE